MKQSALRILVTWFVLVSGPLFVRAAAQQVGGDQPQLGPAPVFPKDLTGFEPSAPGAAAVPVPQANVAVPAVNPADREAARAFFTTYYLNAPAPAHGWTGNRTSCDAGITSPAFRDAVLLRINYFRAMAGVPAQVTLSDTYNAKAQQAALMMSANNQLNHNPPASWLCYSADGAGAAGNSNLALGTYGWDAINLYMRDPGSGNGAAGHRRWILYPQTQNMGTGDIPPDGGAATNALWVFDSHMWEARPPTREMFVAWPPPGYVPFQVVFPRWSFSYPAADFSQASVTVTSDGQGVSVTKEAVANGYGESTLVWAITGMADWASWPRPTADTTYRVTITGVLIGGAPQSFIYDVIVMDPAPAPSARTGNASSIGLTGATLNGTANPNGASTTAFFQYGTTTSYGAQTSSQNIGAGTSDVSAAAPLTGLACGTLYHFRFVATNAGGTSTGSDNTFSTLACLPPPPTVTTRNASTITRTQATLNGTVNANGSSAIAYFQYGTTTSYGYTTPAQSVGAGTTAVAVTAPLSGLPCGTLHHFRAAGTNAGGTVYGQDVTLVTVACPRIETDFNGDGLSDLLWRNRVNGELMFWLMNGTTKASEVRIAGPGDRQWRIVAVADFNRDGNPDLVMRHATSGEDQIWLMNGATHSGTVPLPTIADARWQIAAATDFNADGQPDLLWRNAANGDVVVWYLNGGAYAGFEWVASIKDPAWVMAGVADFNADTKPDIVWRNTADGRNLVWYMNGAAYADYAWLPSETDTNWTIVGVTDYDGDGTPDLLWRNTATGENRSWRMANTTLLGTDALPAMLDVDYEAIGAAAGRTRAVLNDFNADGHPDILWHNDATGESRIWYMAGSKGDTRLADVSIGTEVDVNWKTVAVADFNQDGLPDIVWRNSATGQNKIALMTGRTKSGEMSLPTIADTNWTIVGVGDFNQDGHPDLAWRNYATGANIIWFLKNGAYFDWTAPPTIADTTWKIVAVGDFNGDGWPDLFWRNSVTGVNIAWFLVKGVYSGWGQPPTIADPTWQIVGAGDYNGDGKADLLWRNATTGQNLIWYLRDGAYLDWAPLPSLPIEWKTGVGQ